MICINAIQLNLQEKRTGLIMINFVKFDIFIFKNRLKKEEFND